MVLFCHGTADGFKGNINVLPPAILTVISIMCLTKWWGNTDIQSGTYMQHFFIHLGAHHYFIFFLLQTVQTIYSNIQIPTRQAKFVSLWWEMMYCLLWCCKYKHCCKKIVSMMMMMKKTWCREGSAFNNNTHLSMRVHQRKGNKNCYILSLCIIIVQESQHQYHCIFVIFVSSLCGPF